MIQISKQEAKYLNLEKGIQYGNGLSKTRSNKPHYYATESPTIKGYLRDYRISRMQKSVTNDVM